MTIMAPEIFSEKFFLLFEKWNDREIMIISHIFIASDELEVTLMKAIIVLKH